MTFRLCECPICHKQKRVYANWFFRCCGRAWDIKQNLMEANDKLYRPEKGAKKLDNNDEVEVK